jgi:hypothetical protein
VLLAIISVTPTPAGRRDDADIINFSHQSSAALPLSAAPASAPTILAQGRCYNGRCY